jgi:ABC-type multidrug transport system ATPase subunit
MDPKARRQVWEMIKSLKAGRIVLLTTHAMEEADALSDRIAVMGKGELKCIGSSLYLKNTFSNGYRY